MRFPKTTFLATLLFLFCGPFSRAGSSQGCFFNGPETLREFRDVYEVVIEAELTFGVPANEEREFPGRCAVTIQKFIKGTPKNKEFEVSEVITLEEETSHSVGERLLLCCDPREEETYWLILHKSSPAVTEYVMNAPGEDATQTKQLSYFLPFLKHLDPVIAHDALLEISATSDLELIANVNELRKLLNRENLRKQIASERTDSTIDNMIGTYATLLGLCGIEEDAEFLRSIIQEGRSEHSFGIYGVICGYLLLTGERGLDFIDETILNKIETSYSDRDAVIQALRFMETITDGPISKDRLCQSLRILLDHPDLADTTILELAEFEDWSVMAQLMTLYLQKEFNNPRIMHSIARYLLTATKSWDETTGEAIPAHVLEARRYLITLEELEPHTVAQANYYFSD